MQDARSLFYSIVVPAFNESGIISDSLDKISNYLDKKKLRYEIILVNDGSYDNTEEVIRRVIDNTLHSGARIKLLKNAKNEGKGSAVRKGVLSACGDYIIYIDADLSVPISEIDRIIDALNFDREAILVGAREDENKSTKVTRPFLRKFKSRIYNLIVNLLFSLGIKDVFCGFKCFPAKAAKDIFKAQGINGWIFDVEVLLAAKKNGLRIKEIPISWTEHLPTHINVMPDFIFCFFDLTGLFFRNLCGRI